MNSCDPLNEDEEMDGSATCMSRFIKCLESYFTESTKHGVQKFTKGKGASKGGREAYLLYQHLERVNQGHLGIEYHNRVYNITQSETLSESKILRSKKDQTSITISDTSGYQ